MRLALILLVLTLMSALSSCQGAVTPDVGDAPTAEPRRDGIGGLDALSGANLTYWEHIAPLVNEFCLPCHGDGQPIPPRLDTLDAIRAQSSSIERVIADGTMPPWHVDDACSTYRNSPAINNNERATLLTWIAAGLQEGVVKDPSADEGLMPSTGLIGETLELVMSGAYTPGADRRETRCVTIPWPATEDAFVTGFHITPGQRQAVRSVQLFAAAAARTAQVQSLNELSFEQGYPCAGFPVWPAEGSQPASPAMADDVRYLGTWLPGDGTRQLPPSTGALIRPGATIILQIDYDTTQVAPGPDITSVEVEVASSVPYPIVMVPLTDLSWLSAQPGAVIPAEGDEVTFSVSREVSTQLLPYYGARAGLDSASNPHIHAVLPMMGPQGKQSVVWVQRAGEATCIADVIHFDPSWLRDYVLSEPVLLSEGDTLNLACTYTTAGGEIAQRLGPMPEHERCLAYVAMSDSVEGASPSICEPNCTQRNCGSDGCGGSCGTCTAPLICDPAGVCLSPCVPNCAEKVCGDDGCGGSCGACTEEAPNCTETGECVGGCIVNCEGRACGDDGCGGSCGACPENAPYCDLEGQCQDLCIGECGARVCGDDGCGGSCGECPEELPSCTVQGQCAPCLPDCLNRECGGDGCGGSCGTCSPTKPNCTDAGLCTNLCIPSCDGKVCGADGCGGNCGVCPMNAPFCTEGECFAADGCSPNCENKECGADGCGGNCGLCPNTSPQCIQGVCGGTCVADCQGQQCGDNGCGGVCGLCPDWAPTCEDGWCTCTPSCIGKMCGSDGCTGSCGTCPSGSSCVDNICALD